MQDVREVLRRSQAGQSARQIARETGLDRKTVGRYLEQARAAGRDGDAVTDELAGAVGGGCGRGPGHRRPSSGGHSEPAARRWKAGWQAIDPCGGPGP
jgi:hypothetical protein